MRIRTWIFAVVVAAAFAINLGLVSLRIAQTGEDTVRARLAQSANGLRSQLELIDARLSPRAAAEVPELADATRSPADPAQPMVRPDDRALRAAASALAPEPDLLAVVNAQGALISRRAKPTQPLDDIGKLPLAKASLERTPVPTFAVYDGVAYRIAAARVPGNGAAVIAGAAADDRLASQLKSQIDADVTLIVEGKVIASSLSGDARARVLRWSAAPGQGYGTLQVYLPLIGNALSGKLPRGATRYAVRGALVPLDGGVQAALTVPASPYLGWLARYQAFYLLGLTLFVLLAFFWGLFAPAEKVVIQRVEAPPRTTPTRPIPRAMKPSLVGTDVGEALKGPEQPAGDVPWGEAIHGSTAESKPLLASALAGLPTPTESLDPIVPPGDAEAEPAVVLGKIDPSHQPAWGPESAAAQPLDAGLFAERTNPGGPGEAALAQARLEAAEREGEFPEMPGDAPTRVGGVSAALMDKLRARDDEPAPAEPEPSPQAIQQGEAEWAAAIASTQAAAEEPALAQTEETPAPIALPGPAAPEPEAAPAMPEAEAASAMSEAEAASAMPEPEVAPAMPEPLDPEEPPADPDEAHWHETYDAFVALKEQLGEAGGKLSYDKFAAKLAKNRADLIAKHHCRAVRFSVYAKDGKASLKASAIR
jgi:hypothetical protein